MLKQKIFLLIFLSGCASSKPPTATTRPDRVIATDEKTGSTIRSVNEPGPAPVILRSPQDSVWRAVALTYLFLKVPVTYDDKSSGEQGNKMFAMSRTFDGHAISHYLNCGDDPFRGPNADSQRVTASLITRTRPVSATQTSIEIIFSGYISKVGQSGTLYCTSTGSLELHMAEMVASRIPQS
jgi:hypothetical protein